MKLCTLQHNRIINVMTMVTLIIYMCIKSFIDDMRACGMIMGFWGVGYARGVRKRVDAEPENEE